MVEKACPLIDVTPGKVPRYVCYANGRLLGKRWLLDYCLSGSKLGHESCPVLTPTYRNGQVIKSPDSIARELYKRLNAEDVQMTPEEQENLRKDARNKSFEVLNGD